ncbi:MAG: AAA family ATPase [Bacteroidia bacterium]
MYNKKKTLKKSHNWKIVLLFFAAASALAVKINYFSPVKYQAVAQIKLKEKLPDNHAGWTSSIMNHPLSQTVSYDAVLRNAVMDATKNKNLNVEYFQTQALFKTELYTFSPITVSYEVKNETFYKQEFDLKSVSDDNFILTYEIDGVKRERSGEFGKEIHETLLKFTINKNSKINSASEELLLTKNIQFTIYSNEALADNLLKYSVDISSSESGTTAISVTGGIPEKSMELANSISEALLANSNRLKELELIDQELAKVSDQLETARIGISAKAKGNKSAVETMDVHSYGRPSENIEAQKKYLESQAAILENLSDKLRQNINNDNVAINFETINDPLIPEYISAINDRINRKGNVPDAEATALDEEIIALKNTLADVIRNTRKKIALQQEKIYNLIPQENQEPSIAVVKEDNPDLQKQNLYLTEKLFNYMADKRTEMQSSLAFSEHNFIQKATLPREPSNANATIVWILAIISGFIIGCIAAFVFNKILKLSKNTTEDVESETSLSYFANIEDGNKKDLSTPFKSLCTKVLLLRNEGEKQIITVTSDEPGAGKTFVATHLAKSLASLDLNILLVDMNLSNPSVEEKFETRVNCTLANVLQKQNSIQEAVQITSFPGLDILIAGEFPNGMNSLIATNNISKILNELKGHYDVILIDAADTSNSNDAMPCIKFSNSTLFVVKTGVDERQVAAQTAQIKTEYKIETIYFISNDVKKTTKKKPHQSKRNNKEIAVAAPPFMKRAALWSY